MPEQEWSTGEPFPASDVFETAASEARRVRGQDEALRRRVTPSSEDVGLAADTAKLLYELRVHQVELEMQNEELRRAQLEIEASRSRYFELYDLAPVGYLTITEKGLVSEANLTAAGILDSARGELVRQPFTRFILPADQDIFFNHRRCLLTSGESQRCEIRLVKKGGESFWVRLETRLAHKPDGCVELRAALSDVSERKRMEETIRVSEARHRILFESARDALMTLAPPAWRFTSGNRAALALFGAQSEAEFTARTPWQYSPRRQPGGGLSQEKALAMIDLAMRNGAHSFEWTYERAPGDEFAATVVLSRLELEGVQLLQATVRDESETQRERAALAQTERLASMGMLAASVGHEINNPLSYVQANLELLSEELRERDRSHEHASPERAEKSRTLAHQALDGARRIARISRVLNSFSRVDTLEPSAADLNRAIEAAVTLAFNEIRFGGKLSRDYGAVPNVRGSEGKLSQVFLNLLSNASHAIEAGQAANPCISLRTWAEGNRVFAEVVDTGKGIAPEDLAHVFEPFFSTKSVGVGSGLGLPICRRILTEFGADIWVESAPGQGSRFVLGFAAWVAPTAAEQAPKESGVPAPAPRGRILLVDDEALLLITMARLLEEHEIVTAGSGKEAKVLLEQDRNFDLVICDLMMPDMTGIELHQWLTKSDPEVAERMAFVTGGAFGPVSTEYLLQCGNLIIDKPFESEPFRRVVSEKIRAVRALQSG